MANRRSSSANGSGVRAGRVARLRKALGATDASHLLVTNPKDVAYLTGFLGGDSYFLVPARGRSKPVVISDFRYQEELECVDGLARVHIRDGSMIDAVGEVAREHGVDRLAIQGEHMTIALRGAIAKRVGGTRRVLDTTGIVGRLRQIKDEAEIKVIRKAVRLQERALEAVVERMEPGQSELEIASMLEGEMKMRGSIEPGFTTIVAAGANGSLPHYRPGSKKISRNSTVLIDWGSVVDGYHGDMTRTFAIGRWPKKMREIYEIVREAQERSAAALAPGMLTSEVDGVAREYISRHGYGEAFGHGLGHGMGLDGHEDPRLTHMMAPVALEEGMVVTVEPGIYLPGIGGVRIEDDYVVTARGARNLCSLPKDIDWATR